MANAVDKAVQSEDSQKKADPAVPQAVARKRQAKAEKAHNEKNKVIETYYALSAGHKLILCKKKMSGSVYKVMVGSSKDKDTGAQIRAKIKELSDKKQLVVIS